MRANVFSLGCVCVYVQALSLDKPQSGAAAASRALLQQEKTIKKEKKRKR